MKTEMVQHAAGVTKLESQMSLPPLNQNISNLWKSHVSQPASAMLKNFSAKFGDLIARLTEVISKKIKGNNDNNLGSPKVQRDWAIELAGEFFKYKLYTPELTPKDWSLIVEVTLEQHPDLRGKTENNIQQVIKAVSSLIGNPAFRRDVENQLELDQKKAIENLRLEPEVASPQPREPEFTIDLGNSSDVTAISRTIVRSWLQAEAINPDKSLSEFFGQWCKHLQSKQNVINNDIENLDNVIEESMLVLNKYYRNIEIEKLKKELVEYICIATGFDDKDNRFPEE